ncbi:hypothetical protein ACS0TY_035083 [Phlomoides rotata]
MDHPLLKTLVESKWDSWDIRGWEDGKLDISIQKKKEDIHHLDLYDDVFGLEEEEAARRAALMQDLLSDLKWKNAIIFQKSRTKWIVEGDGNSKLFHSFVNRRYKKNEINGLWINGE